jgi:Zn ribbon nucleic-acid-binding protein
MNTVERGIPGIRCPLCGEEDTLAVRIHDALVVCLSDNQCEINADMLRTQINGMTDLLKVVEALPQKG